MGKRKAEALALPQLLELLGNWNMLNKKLMDLSEAEVNKLLTHEREKKNRITFVLRLHSRLNKLRAERERRSLVGGAA